MYSTDHWAASAWKSQTQLGCSGSGAAQIRLRPLGAKELPGLGLEPLDPTSLAIALAISVEDVRRLWQWWLGPSEYGCGRNENIATTHAQTLARVQAHACQAQCGVWCMAWYDYQYHTNNNTCAITTPMIVTIPCMVTCDNMAGRMCAHMGGRARTCAHTCE